MFIALASLGIFASAFAMTGGDVRVTQLNVAMAFAVFLGLHALYAGRSKPFKNKWFLILIAYLPIHAMIAPRPDIQLFGIGVSNFWIWRPMTMILAFSFMLWAVATADLAKRSRLIIDGMVLSGAIMACYVILQYFRLDQFFFQTGGGADGRMAGFIGNPTLVSPYIAMMVPLALFTKRRAVAVIMSLAVLATESTFALGGLVVSLLLYFATIGRVQLLIGFAGFILCVFLAVLGLRHGVLNDSDRFDHWPQIAQDINTSIIDGGHKYPVTGIGLGSFRYTYHVKRNNIYHQAHNDYLEFAYNTGLTGILLFLASIWFMVRQNFSISEVWNNHSDRYRMALLASFVCIAFCAFGTFIWQIGPTIYATILVAGLLHNKEEVSNV